MASNAISAQGTLLYVAGASASTKVIADVTEGFPTIVTVTSHGYSNGDRITLAGITSATGLNDTFTIRNVTTHTFAVDYNSIGMTAGLAGTPTAAGTAWTQITNLTSLKGLDGSAKEIETTNHDSAAVEMLLGLQDNGNLNLEIDGYNADAGQLVLEAAKADGAIRSFKFVLPAGSTPTCTFTGFVKKFDLSAPINDKYKRTCDIRISGAVTWS